MQWITKMNVHMKPWARHCEGIKKIQQVLIDNALIAEYQDHEGTWARWYLFDRIPDLGDNAFTLESFQGFAVLPKVHAVGEWRFFGQHSGNGAEHWNRLLNVTALELPESVKPSFNPQSPAAMRGELESNSR
jgi:hypothetical protein